MKKLALILATLVFASGCSLFETIDPGASEEDKIELTNCLVSLAICESSKHLKTQQVTKITLEVCKIRLEQCVSTQE